MFDKIVAALRQAEGAGPFSPVAEGGRHGPEPAVKKETPDIHIKPVVREAVTADMVNDKKLLPAGTPVNKGAVMPRRLVPFGGRNRIRVFISGKGIAPQDLCPQFPFPAGNQISQIVSPGV